MRSDPFFPPFIAGVESAIAPSGQLLVVRLVADQDAEIEAYRELSQTGRVDGVFVTDIRADDQRPALLKQLGLPAVTLNRPTVPSTAPAVCMDDRPAVREAMEHLVATRPSADRARRRSEQISARRRTSAGLGRRAPGDHQTLRGPLGRSGFQRGRRRGRHPATARSARSADGDSVRQ